MAAAVNGRMAVYVLLGPIGGVVWFVGPALGAVIVATAGARVALIANGVTFLLSAWFISRTSVPAARRERRRRW